MNLTRFRGVICWTVGLLALASVAHAQKSRVFHGEVSDSQCALNVHSLTRSHQEMLKSKSMGGTSNTCSVYCIEHLGGYVVLSVATTCIVSIELIWCTAMRDSELWSQEVLTK